MDSYQEFKMFYYSNIILFIVILFVIIYIIVNWENVYIGNYLSGEIVKPILISGILFLILHMLLTWDDEQIYLEQKEVILPKYKLGKNIELETGQNKDLELEKNFNLKQVYQNVYKNGYRYGQENEQIPNEIISANINIPQINPIKNQQNHKYQIFNKFDTPNNFKTHNNPTLEQFSKIGQNLSYTDNNKLSNQNIFISQKNSGKYGIKFI